MSIGAYLKRTSGEEISPFPAILIIIALLGFFILFKRSDVAAFAAFGGIALVVLLLYRVEVLPGLFLFYVAMLDDNVDLTDHFLYPIVYYWQFNIILILAVIVLLLVDRTVNYVSHSSPLEKNRDQPGGTDIIQVMVAILTIWLVFQTFRGYALGNNRAFIIYDFGHISIIASYFFWRMLFRYKRKIISWLAFLSILSALAAVQVLILVASSWENIATLILQRVYTHQGQLSFAAIPLLSAFLLTEGKNWKRILIVIGLLLVLLQVLVIQQRSMWVADGLAVVLFFLFFSFRHGWNLHGLRSWLLGAGGMLAAGFAFLLVGAKFFGVDLTVLLSRWQDFGTLEDASTRMRIFDYQYAIQVIKEAPFLGSGMGSTVFSVTNGQYRFGIDNSYLMALVKGGIPYLVLLLAIFIFGIREAWIVYRRADDQRTQLIGAAILCSLVAVLLSGGAILALVYYRFIMVWMMLIAAATVIRETMREKEGIR